MPVFLPGAGAVRAQNAAAPEQGAAGLLTTGEAAYNAGNWNAAAAAFSKFLADYGPLPGAAPAAEKVRPLLGICHARLDAHDAALPLLEEALKSPDKLAASLRTDLRFFAGLCLLRTGKPAAARKYFGGIFSDPSSDAARKSEALVLGGATYAAEKNWPETIRFFRSHRAEIAAAGPAAASRCEIILLHALIQEKELQAARSLAENLSAKMAEIRQHMTFSSLLFELGGSFSKRGEHHAAIATLRLIPAAAEISERQSRMLARAEADLSAAEKSKIAPRATQLRAGISELQREIAALAENPHFDSAARLRLADAYFQLGRTREACLILDQMVRQMKPDATVEAATASLIRGWMSLERFTRAEKTADLYLERCAALPEKPNLPEVMFLRAEAIAGQFHYQRAADAFSETAARFPKHAIAARARFMAAYNILQLEDYKRAAAMLDGQLKTLPRDDAMWAHAAFWRAMASYFDQQWEDARRQFSPLAESGGEYADDAEFRIAYSFFAEAEHALAARKLRDFIGKFPASEFIAEAKLTLGDSLAGQGELEEAMREYASIPPEAAGFHDEGWMKRGNILKTQKDLEGMKRHYAEFLRERTGSPRVAEALRWLAWIAKQQGRPEEARQQYREAIAKLGNDPARPGIEEIFLGFIGTFPKSERPKLAEHFRGELREALAAEKPNLAVRLAWALWKSDPAEKPLPEGIAPDPQHTAPVILADLGDAFAGRNEAEAARKTYEGLRKWWPRAPERDRAFAGLGFLALRAGNDAGALGFFDRFERTSIMSKSAPDERGVSLVESALGGKVALARAGILAKSSPENAVPILLAVQKSKAMPAEARCDALLEMARLHAKEKRFREALPYYEQVYLLFNRFPEKVAAAYYERGEALEKLGQREKAREVFSELAARDDLKSLPISELGGRRASELGNPSETPVR